VAVIAASPRGGGRASWLQLAELNLSITLLKQAASVKKKH